MFHLSDQMRSVWQLHQAWRIAGRRQLGFSLDPFAWKLLLATLAATYMLKPIDFMSPHDTPSLLKALLSFSRCLCLWICCPCKSKISSYRSLPEGLLASHAAVFRENDFASLHHALQRQHAILQSVVVERVSACNFALSSLVQLGQRAKSTAKELAGAPDVKSELTQYEL